MREWACGAGLDRPVFAADMPGYGKSQDPSDGRVLGIAEMADWNAHLLDVLGIRRAHLIGHSMGCQVALALARRHPERAAGLVLIGPTEGGDLVPFWRTVVGLAADVFFETMLYNGTLFKMYLQMGPARFFATVAKMWRGDDPVDNADQVGSPVLIVRGSLDVIVPEQAARQFALDLPQGSFTTIEGSAHAVQFNKPQAFAPLARAFWERAEIQMSAD
jgi:pimeloyl-ACP methyl ester carboxylesterase